MNYCYPSTDELAEQLSIRFLDYLSKGSKSGKHVNIALSGGNTPRAFFERIGMLPGFSNLRDHGKHQPLL